MADTINSLTEGTEFKLNDVIQGNEVVTDDVNNLNVIVRALCEKLGLDYTTLGPDGNGNDLITRVENIDTMISKMPNDWVDNNEGLKTYLNNNLATKLRVVDASTDEKGGVKLANEFTAEHTIDEEKVICEASLANSSNIVISKDMLTLIVQNLMTKVPLLAGNGKIIGNYIPDNYLSDRVFGGLVTATLVNGNIKFLQPIDILDSSNEKKPYYSFQVNIETADELIGSCELTNGVWTEASKNPENTNEIKIGNGDWIESYYEDSNAKTRTVNIIRIGNGIKVKTQKNTIGQDSKKTIDISRDLNSLITDNISSIKSVNDLKNATSLDNKKIPSIELCKNLVGTTSGYYCGANSIHVKLVSPGYTYQTGTYHGNWQTHYYDPDYQYAWQTIDVTLPSSIQNIRKLTWRLVDHKNNVSWGENGIFYYLNIDNSTDDSIVKVSGSTEEEVVNQAGKKTERIITEYTNQK